MKTLLLVAIGASLVNNVVLSQFLGLCPFLGVSKKVNTAAGMGGAVVFVITIASAATWLINHFVLEMFQFHTTNRQKVFPDFPQENVPVSDLAEHSELHPAYTN